jgi:coronin-7
MDAEVNRLLLLTKSSILPVSYIPVRKSYKEFHEDLYPPTASNKAACNGLQWFEGNNSMVEKVALSPVKKMTSNVLKKESNVYADDIRIPPKNDDDIPTPPKADAVSTPPKPITRTLPVAGS